MIKHAFLNNLKKQGRLELVAVSGEISESYQEKSANCLKSAKILEKNSLYENSISMSYYAMYNQLLALLFLCGIKCENHTGSILLLKLVFEKQELWEIRSEAKKERIDKQYYVTGKKDDATKETADELLKDAENFILEIKVAITKLSNDSIAQFRENIAGLKL